jgi:hypothetical protein
MTMGFLDKATGMDALDQLDGKHDDIADGPGQRR